MRADQEDDYRDRDLVSKPHDLAIKIKPSIRLNLITAMHCAVSEAGMSLLKAKH